MLITDDAIESREIMVNVKVRNSSYFILFNCVRLPMFFLAWIPGTGSVFSI